MYLIIKSNVDFTKLSRDYKESVDKALENIAIDSSDKTRDNLDKSKSITGGQLEPLSKLTKALRKRGVYWEGGGTGLRGVGFKPDFLKTGLPNKGGDKPLVYSGSLINSIQGKDNKMEMLGYGKQHHEGYKVKWRVPERPFIQSDIKKETQKKFKEDIERKLRR